jgi:uroporphyrinogen III methyltransferase/synthase
MRPQSLNTVLTADNAHRREVPMSQGHQSHPQPGTVYLVGAGPGDPGLITVRGAECLAQADVVLYDGLVNPLLLRLTTGRCERTARVRRQGTDVTPQEAINERLIAEARAGHCVVRLKGGDPYIFGRGSEEAAALQDAGIPFEVVPGITAATGAGEYAGFSFTHRETTSAVAFVTGHEDPTRDHSRIDYQALAAFPGTLVFYMGLGRIREICSSLTSAGLSETTPAALICHASLPTQQVIEGTLSSLPDLAQSRALKPPSLIVVGQCVLQRQSLCWFERLPHFGLSIGITRPEGQTDEIVRQVVRLGGEPVLMPLLKIEQVDREQEQVVAKSLNRLHDYDWLVFTSVNGVKEFFRHLHQSGRDSRALGRTRIAAIGVSTSDSLKDFGILSDLVPSTFQAEALAEALVNSAANQRVLWLRASRGRDVLPKTLRAAGIAVEELIVYESNDIDAISPEVLDRIRTNTLHWIGLSSPAMANRLAVLLNQAEIPLSSVVTRFASISPLTSDAARTAGIPIAAEAEMATWQSLLQAIAQAHAIQPGD